MTSRGGRGCRRPRWCVAAITVALVATVAGCTTASRRPTAATANATSTATPTASATTSTSTSPPSMCPVPSAATAAPTDFPHPVPAAPRAAPTTDNPADDALAAQGLAATRTLGGPISASAFQHYLDATGDYLALPVDGLLSTNPALVTELNGVLVTASADAVQRVARSGASTCPAVAFTSGWQPHADVADDDWRYTLGRFYYQVLGTVTRDAGSDATPPGSGAIRVSFRAAIGDTYDFDPGSAFARFEQLALDGRAADYLDGGLTATRSAAVVTSSAELASPGFG